MNKPRPSLHLTSHGLPGAARVVCLHGFMGAGTDWLPLVDRLRDRYQVDLVDLPGHGESVEFPPSIYTWNGALEELQKILRGASAVVGYSMGGRLALAATLSAPTDLRAAVIISSSAGLESEEERRRRRALDEQRARQLVSLGAPAFLEEWYRQPLFASLRKQPALLKKLIDQRRGLPNEWARALCGLSVAEQPSYWDRLPTSLVPALFVAGQEDPAYAVHARRAADLSPRGSLFMVPAAGHLPQEEAPHVTLDRIVGYLHQNLE